MARCRLARLFSLLNTRAYSRGKCHGGGIRDSVLSSEQQSYLSAETYDELADSPDEQRMMRLEGTFNKLSIVGKGLISLILGRIFS